MKLLVVVDMQNDFIDGSLGSPEAQSIVPKVAAKINEYKNANYPIIYTRDTHKPDYLDTQEGKRLPVPHCIRGTEGWEIKDGLYQKGCIIDDKPTFGSTTLPLYIITNYHNRFDTIELVGLCTDICVVSNALMLKAQLPETTIVVDSSCCAGTSVEAHKAALTVLKSCQVEVINED
jgi:nicotinamidase-related amidase